MRRLGLVGAALDISMSSHLYLDFSGSIIKAGKNEKNTETFISNLSNENYTISSDSILDIAFLRIYKDYTPDW